MWVRHTHMWSEVSRKFNPGIRADAIKNITATSHQLEQMGKIVFGFTIIESKCFICNELKHTEVTGDVS